MQNEAVRKEIYCWGIYGRDYNGINTEIKVTYRRKVSLFRAANV